MLCLQAYGLKPQFFLKDPATLAAQQQLPPSISKASKHSKRISQPSQDASSAEATSEGGAFSLPGDILDTLEVFVLSASEVAERMESLRVYHEARRAARSAGVCARVGLGCTAHRLCAMCVTSCLKQARLLWAGLHVLSCEDMSVRQNTS